MKTKRNNANASQQLSHRNFVYAKSPKAFSASVIFASIYLFSCGSDNFKGADPVAKKPAVAESPATPTKIPTGTPPPPPPGTKLIKLGCSGDSLNQTVTANFEGSKNDNVYVEGEFCPTASGELNILFVVDQSGSMEQNDPRGLLGFGGCGRQKAVQTIISKLSAGLRAQDKVNVGLVNFSTTAETVLGMAPIQNASSQLNTSTLCKANGATNYAAAFDAARVAFSNVTGPKALYFISDGVPAVAGGGMDLDQTAIQNGLTASQTLRSTYPDMVLNAIFLNASGSVGSGGFNPQTYLGQVTGAPERVKLVNNAEDMSEEIKKFALPAIEIQENTAKGQYSSQSASNNQQMDFTQFVRSSSRPGVWGFTTKPFKLYGVDNQVITNTVSISALDKKGNTQTMTINILFKQKP